MHTLKKSIQDALAANDLAGIVSLAVLNRRALSILVRAAYDKDTLAGWRAIKAVGLVAKELARTEHEFLRETMRKFFWSLSDESGGIGWSAPEMIGEIVAADPKRFCDFIPMIAEVYNVEEDVFRPGVMYALGRIAETAPELIVPHLDIVMKALSDPNPETQYHALGVIEQIHRAMSSEQLANAKTVIANLVSDHREIWIYSKDNYSVENVGDKSLNLISLVN